MENKTKIFRRGFLPRSLSVWAIAIALLLPAPCAFASGLKASWYSEASLKKEGTWKTSKGVMANGKAFDERRFTCATRIYPLGTRLRIVNVRNGNSCEVIVSDRIGKRFGQTRIDLSKAAFEKIASLREGLIDIEVKIIKKGERPYGQKHIVLSKRSK